MTNNKNPLIEFLDKRYMINEKEKIITEWLMEEDFEEFDKIFITRKEVAEKIGKLKKQVNLYSLYNILDILEQKLEGERE